MVLIVGVKPLVVLLLVNVRSSRAVAVWMHKWGIDARHDLLHAEHLAVHLLVHLVHVSASALYVLVLLEAVTLVLAHIGIVSLIAISTRKKVLGRNMNDITFDV